MSSPLPVRKRRRPAYSCTECRRRKVRCDHAMPCGQCIAQKKTSLCAYDGNRRSSLVDHGSRTLSSDRVRDKTEEARVASRSSEVSQSPNNTERFQGTISKTRVFGKGHWMTVFSMVFSPFLNSMDRPNRLTTPKAEDLSILDPIGGFYERVFQQGSFNPSGDFAKAILKCKELARDLKKQRPSRRRLPAAIYQSFPDRQVMDELVGLYFNMFESCYRVIFQPSFLVEYKSFLEQPESAESSFLLQLSLVLAAGGRLHGDAEVRHDIAKKSQDWIHISQTWLSAPLEKDRLTLKSIQVQCLLILCRQIHYVGADLVWISIGSLMRMAMHMGLHQDPAHLGEMNELQKQIRRRLWYTILEMNVQAALDSGMSPMIHDGDYNTQPPSNVSDRDLLHATRQQHEKTLDASPESSNQSSLQSLLAKSLPLRLQVTTLMNSLQDQTTYDHILAVGKELALASGEITAKLDRATSGINGLPATQFAQSHCSHLIRRFPMCLHFVYAIKSKKNPLYSHSQKVCLEAALDIISLLDDDLYSRLLLSGGGMFRDVSTRAAILIFMELSPDAEAEVSSLTKRRYQERQSFLLQYAQRLVQYAEDRIREGETSVKTYVFLRLMMARAEARFKDCPFTENDMTEALREGLDKCQTMLKDRLLNVNQANVHDDAVPGSPLGAWTPNELNEPSYSDFPTDNFSLVNDVNIDFDFLSDQLPSQWVDQTWF